MEDAIRESKWLFQECVFLNENTIKFILWYLLVVADQIFPVGTMYRVLIPPIATVFTCKGSKSTDRICVPSILVQIHRLREQLPHRSATKDDSSDSDLLFFFCAKGKKKEILTYYFTLVGKFWKEVGYKLLF